MARYSFRHYRSSRTMLGVGIGVIVIALGVGGWAIWNYQRTNSGQREMNRVRSALEKHVILPSKEEPSLATVEDASKLTDAFLKANAENGDKVLIYPSAGKVYIYRPSVRKLAAMGPLTVDGSAAQVRGARIAIRNGNGNSAISERIKSTLQSQYPSAVIGAIDQSRRQDYPHTIVIDLTNDEKYDLVTQLMQQFGAQRGVLPQNEARPSSADILILTGVDSK